MAWHITNSLYIKVITKINTRFVAKISKIERFVIIVIIFNMMNKIDKYKKIVLS